MKTPGQKIKSEVNKTLVYLKLIKISESKPAQVLFFIIGSGLSFYLFSLTLLGLFTKVFLSIVGAAFFCHAITRLMGLIIELGFKRVIKNLKKI